MKYDPICAVCVSGCKQPASAKLISCPQFKPASRNLSLFDMEGGVSKDLAQKTKSGKKKNTPGD
jgi:hypothetical protein